MNIQMQWFLMYRHEKDKKLVFFVHASQIKKYIRQLYSAEQSLKENPWRIKPASRHESLLRQHRFHTHPRIILSDTDERICPIGGYIMILCRFFCVHKITLLSVFISKKWIGPFAWLPVYLLCLIKEKISTIVISITVSAYH